MTTEEVKRVPYNEVFCKDCLPAMKDYPDNTFDLAIVDTNWGIGEAAKAASRPAIVTSGNKQPLQCKPKKFENSNWDDKQPSQNYFTELFRVAKFHIIMGENYLRFKQKSKSTGRIVWNKVNYNNDFSDCEIMWTNLHSSVRLVEYMWNGMMQGESLENPRKQQGNKSLNEVRITPAHKPVLLYKWLMTNYAKPGWKILSTHVGGGSDRIAAWDLGFDFTGMENNLKTFKAQDRRFFCRKIAPELYRGY